jgi:hypothetical protein
MPHINLLFPFVPERDLDDAAHRLRSALEATNCSCTLELSRFRSFAHGNVHLEPSVAV